MASSLPWSSRSVLWSTGSASGWQAPCDAPAESPPGPDRSHRQPGGSSLHHGFTFSIALWNTSSRSVPYGSHILDRAVENKLGDRLFAFLHQVIDKPGDQNAFVLRIGQERPFCYFLLLGISNSPDDDIHRPAQPPAFSANDTPGRRSPAYDFGRLAPYLDRDFLRPSTPTVSSVPRTM